MKPAKHIIASVSTGIALWLFTRSIYAGLLCFISGIFLDFDHVIEYIIHHGWRNFAFKDIYDACEETGRQEGDRGFKRLYLVFHAGEIAILLWVVTIYTKNIYPLAIAIGYSLHLILDYIGNPLYLYSYFMFWRVINRFDVDKLFRRQKDGDL